MIRTFDQLLNLANNNLQQAGKFDIEHSAAYVNISMAYSLLAIAQELHRRNDNQKLDTVYDELEDFSCNW